MTAKMTPGPSCLMISVPFFLYYYRVKMSGLEFLTSDPNFLTSLRQSIQSEFKIGQHVLQAS